MIDDFKKVVDDIIKSTGIPKGTKSWTDYETLKLAFLEYGWFGDSTEYDLLIATITEWVGL